MRNISLVLTGVLALAACGKRQEEHVIRIRQRSEATILPGIKLQVGDLQLGAGAGFTVVAKGAPLVQTYARAGERIPFEFEGKKWEIEVVRLENHLQHEDYAHVLVRPK